MPHSISKIKDDIQAFSLPSHVLWETLYIITKQFKHNIFLVFGLVYSALYEP